MKQQMAWLRGSFRIEDGSLTLGLMPGLGGGGDSSLCRRGQGRVEGDQDLDVRGYSGNMHSSEEGCSGAWPMGNARPQSGTAFLRGLCANLKPGYGWVLP